MAAERRLELLAEAKSILSKVLSKASPPEALHNFLAENDPEEFLTTPNPDDNKTPLARIREQIETESKTHLPNPHKNVFILKGEEDIEKMDQETTKVHITTPRLMTITIITSLIDTHPNLKTIEIAPGKWNMIGPKTQKLAEEKKITLVQGKINDKDND